MSRTVRLFAISILASAALLSVACSEQGDAKATEKSTKALTTQLGVNPELWNTGDTPWTKVADVRAVYDALVVIKFDGEMRMKGNVHYFDASGNDYSAIRSKLETAMSALAAGNQPSSTGVGKFRKTVPLAQMRFKNITNVVVMFDHAGLDFPACAAETPADTGCRQIFFTDTQLGGQPARPNDSFYNLSRNSLTYQRSGAAITRDVIFFQNLHREKKADGNYRHIPDNEKPTNNYSLNIYAQAANANGGMHPGWPIIVDPDTGNYGQGGNP